MDFTKLSQLNDKNLKDAAEKKRHSELLLDNTQTQEVIVKSIAKLVEFLDKKVTKTEVVNQLREIGTPDVEKVVTSLDSLHDTLKTHENTDLTEITKVMRGVLDEVKQLPKENLKLPEQKFIDYSKQLTALEKSIQTVEKAVKAQDLVVEAPVVNVPETVVNVEKPDLKPLEKSIDSSSKDVVKAVKGIKLPEFKTDPIEKLLKKTNKLLEELPEYMPSGGGGGGSSWVAVDQNGTPIPIQLNSDGSFTVTVDETASYGLIQFDDTSSASYEYYAYMDKDSNWYVKRLTVATNLFEFTVPVATTYSTGWTNRAKLNYVAKGAAF